MTTQVFTPFDETDDQLVRLDEACREHYYTGPTGARATHVACTSLDEVALMFEPERLPSAVRRVLVFRTDQVEQFIAADARGRFGTFGPNEFDLEDGDYEERGGVVIVEALPSLL